MKDEGPVGGTGVMGHVSGEHHTGPNKDTLTVQLNETLSKTDVTESRTPPAPKRPLPQHNVNSTSSLAMPRPNSVAGRFNAKPLFICDWSSRVGFFFSI